MPEINDDINLRYPIGQFNFNPEADEDQINKLKEVIISFPSEIKSAVSGLSEKQLDTPYRPGGWSVRQLIHHCADSHMNAFIRFKLALSEEHPVIKPYQEAEWANGEDYLAPAEYSLNILEALHKRWGLLLNSLSQEELEKKYFHPANKKDFTLKEAISLYAWHAQHHLAHITSLIQRNGW